jgi:dTMP kinase
MSSSIEVGDATPVRGALITVEGIDGSGKSTLCKALAAALGERAVLLREPGGVVLAERIRELVKDPELSITPAAEALLFAAARAQLVAEKIKPLLDDGKIIVLDRFVDSSLAYQGAGRGLGIGPVSAINELATAGLVPDRTLFLKIDPELAAKRMEGADRLERAGAQFFSDVAQAYDRLAAAESARFRVLDATLGPQDVLESALHAVEDVT